MTKGLDRFYMVEGRQGTVRERLRLRLSYSAERPLEVEMGMRKLLVSYPPPEEVWLFGRDLLRAGSYTPVGGAAVGEGDVVIFRPSLEELSLTLAASRPNEESLTLLLPVVAVVCFLGATCELVPLGEEERFLDLDALVAGLLDT